MKNNKKSNRKGVHHEQHHYPKKQKVENFLAKHDIEFATRIPVKYIREIYTLDMENVLWKNPKFEGLTK